MTYDSDPDDDQRPSSSVDELPDLGSEAIDSIPDYVLDPALNDRLDDELIPDPLPPADSPAVGVGDVEAAIARARRVTLFSSSDELASVPLSRDQLRAVVRSVRNAADPVIVTSRFEGPDHVINTIEFMPRREAPPPKPRKRRSRSRP